MIIIPIFMNTSKTRIEQAPIETQEEIIKRRDRILSTFDLQDRMTLKEIANKTDEDVRVVQGALLVLKKQGKISDSIIKNERVWEKIK